MTKADRCSTKLNAMDLDVITAGGAGGSGTGKTLTSTLLGNYTVRPPARVADPEASGSALAFDSRDAG